MSNPKQAEGPINNDPSEMLNSFIDKYETNLDNFNSVMLKAKTEVGREVIKATEEGKDDETVIHYEEISTTVLLPNDLLNYLSTIGPEKGYGYIKYMVEKRLTDLLRASLKKEIQDAKKGNRPIDMNKVSAPFDVDNWVAALDERKKSGALEVALRACTEEERKKTRAGIETMLMIEGKTVADLTPEHKAAINKSCGYVVV